MEQISQCLPQSHTRVDVKAARYSPRSIRAKTTCASGVLQMVGRSLKLIILMLAVALTFLQGSSKAQTIDCNNLAPSTTGDDWPQINQCLTGVGQANLLAGTFRISQPISFPAANVSLTGQGAANTTIVPIFDCTQPASSAFVNNNGGVLTYNSIISVRGGLRHLSVVDNGVVSGLTVDASPLRSDCGVSNTGVPIIFVSKSNQSLIGCPVGGSPSTCGVTVMGTPPNGASTLSGITMDKSMFTVVRGNTVSNVGEGSGDGGGIVVADSPATVVDGNSVIGPSFGIIVRNFAGVSSQFDGSNSVITNNSMLNVTGRAMKLASSDDGAPPLANLTVTNNTAIGFGRTGLLFEAAIQHGTFTNNVFSGGAGSIYALWITDHAVGGCTTPTCPPRPSFDNQINFNTFRSGDGSSLHVPPFDVSFNGSPNAAGSDQPTISRTSAGNNSLGNNGIDPEGLECNQYAHAFFAYLGGQNFVSSGGQILLAAAGTLPGSTVTFHFQQAGVDVATQTSNPTSGNCVLNQQNYTVSLADGQYDVVVDLTDGNAKIGDPSSGTPVAISGWKLAVPLQVGPPATPAISSVIPASLAQGNSTPITIVGSNLATVGTLNFIPSSGITARNIVASSTQITAIVTVDGSVGTGTASLSATAATGTSNTLPLNIIPRIPSLFSLTPSSGAQGTSVSINLTGANLTGAALSISPSAGIAISNVNVTPVVIGATLVIDPAAATGTYNLSVVTPGGSSNTIPFTVTAGSQDFSLGVSPNSVALPQGSNGTTTVTVTSLNGFSAATGFSISGVPNGVTATFSPASVTPGAGGSASSTLALAVASSAVTGTFTLTITGTSGSLTHSANFSLTISAPPNFQLSVSPNSLTFPQGGSAGATVSVSSLNGFSSATNLSISGLPSGVTGSFSPSVVTPPVGGSAVSTLTLSASSTATSGSFTVNVSGTSGGLSQMTQLTLNITVLPAPDFTVGVSPASVSLIQGGNSGSTVVTVSSINTFSSAVSFTVSGLPSGVTATFSPGSVTPASGGSASSTLTLSASSSAATGSFTLAIAGTSTNPNRNHSTSLGLTVSPPPLPDFSLSASPGSLTLNQGASGTTTVKVTSLSGFSSATNLSVSGVPNGVTATFSPGSVTPAAGGSASSTLTLSASSAAAPGTFTVTVTGASSNPSLSHNMTLSLTINTPPPATPDFSLTLSPGSLSISPGGSGSTTVNLGSIAGFSGTISLSVTGLPAGVSASISPSSVALAAGVTASSTLTLSASSTAAAGTFSVTITGSAGNSNHTTTLTLTIGTPPPDFNLAAPGSLSVIQGSSAGATITLSSLNGFSSATGLSISGLPSGVTASFSPTSVTPPTGGNATSALTLSTSSSAATGSFNLTITGASGSLSHSVNLTLVVSVPPDFPLSVSPSSLSVTQGSSGSTTVTVGSLNGFSSATSLSVAGLPSGVTATFSPASVTPPAGGGAPSTLTLAVSSTAATGTFTLTITGTSGSLSHSVTLSLTVVKPPADFSIAVSPNSLSVNAGGNGSSGSSTVTIASLSGFSGAVNLAISGLPSGVTAVFAPTSVTPAAGGSASSTLTLTASSSAQAGTFTLTITGTSGSLQHSTPLTLKVTAATNPIPSISSISPSTVFSGGAAFTLTINGSGFVNSSVVNVQAGNTSGPRQTTFVSSSQLTVQITASDIANSGSLGISVTNPTPGGGTSNTVTLSVF